MCNWYVCVWNKSQIKSRCKARAKERALFASASFSIQTRSARGADVEATISDSHPGKGAHGPKKGPLLVSFCMVEMVEMMICLQLTYNFIYKA